MAVAIKWIKRPDIPGFIFSSRVTEEDIDTWGKLGLEVAAGGVIYPIIDFSAVNAMPRNLIHTALRSQALLAFIRHPNVRFFVFVAPNEKTRSMLETVFRAVPYKITVNQQAALQILDEKIHATDDPTSPPNRE